jgi:hypothetical protein
MNVMMRNFRIGKLINLYPVNMRLIDVNLSEWFTSILFINGKKWRSDVQLGREQQHEASYEARIHASQHRKLSE